MMRRVFVFAVEVVGFLGAATGIFVFLDRYLL